MKYLIITLFAFAITGCSTTVGKTKYTNHYLFSWGKGANFISAHEKGKKDEAQVIGDVIWSENFFNNLFTFGGNLVGDLSIADAIKGSDIGQESNRGGPDTVINNQVKQGVNVRNRVNHHPRPPRIMRGND